jgi:hypothetical protein
MSREVTNKQIASLEGVSSVEKFNFCYDTVNCAGMSSTFSCTFQDSIQNGDQWDSIQHIVRLTILDIDSINRNLEVRLNICTRLPGKEDKCANPVNKFIEMDLIFFPGSHSSLKERPYYDDIVAKLLPGSGKVKD